MSETVSITIHHKGEATRHALRKGLGIQALCLREKTPIEIDCREADCGICIVKVMSGAEHLSPMTHAEKDFLKAMHADPAERLSCQCRVHGDVELFVEEF